jgi:SET domain-containing protein
MVLSPSSKIYLAPSQIPNAGRGVFAKFPISKGETIEMCPVILIDEQNVPNVRSTKLHDYYFMWGDNPKYHKAAICLGFGSLYNHLYTPNATYKKRKSREMIEFIAIRDIEQDEEITVNYNHGNPNDKSKLWIDSIPEPES